MKSCSRCKKNLREISNYYCRSCNSIRFKKYYQRNKINIIPRTRKWQDTHLEERRLYRKNTNIKLRMDALRAYGEKCRCCGEDKYEFLSVDHINGGGRAHRIAVKSSNIYPWLRRNNYPKGFQILCHNCNMAKGFYGKCPHKDNL